MNYSKSIELYNDNIGRVDYVNHMGDDLTVVNSARVSFGVQNGEASENSMTIDYVGAMKERTANTEL